MNNYILTVDDNERILSLLRVLLVQSGFRVATAASGREAMDFMASEEPSLILLDMSLPDISGAELLKNIRRNSDVPVIIMSALTEAARTAENNPGVSFVSKPFRPADLVDKVRLALEERLVTPPPPQLPGQRQQEW